MAKSITDATSKIHGILEPLESEERHRVIDAALILLGDKPSHERSFASEQDDSESDGESSGTDDLSPATVRWFKKHDLTRDALEHYFHFDDDTVVPIALPGDPKGKREQTITTYLMQGVAALLETGSASFDDETARLRCKEFGCYDSANHAKTLRSLGNQFTGTKKTGWKLTTPGLDAAANRLKPAEE